MAKAKKETEEKSDKPSKAKALEMALAQIEKDFGKEAVIKLGEKRNVDVKAIPTGSLPLDIAIGIGGIPRGRIIDFSGMEGTGKSTCAMAIVAETQKAGGMAAYIDAEHAMDPEYATKIGVDVDKLLLSQPTSGEEGLNIAEKLASSGAIDIIVVDSVAALVPKAEIDGEIGDQFMGLQARMMSQALRKLTGTLAKTNTSIIFLNQIRQKIGVMFGNNETSPGGLALKFYASIRLDIRRIEAIKKGEEIIGNRVRVRVVKNKVSAPFRTAEFDIIFGFGIDKMGCLIDLGVEQGLIEKSGAFYSYKGERLGQGKENAKTFLGTRKDIADELDKTIRENLANPKDKEPLKLEEGGVE